MGRRFMMDNKYQDAINTLNVLLRFDEDAYEGYFLRGIAKYNLDDLLGADADFTIAIEKNPVFTNAYTYRAMVTRMDKGVGLADLCAQMGLTLADAVAVGDSANDVGMLKAAGLSACMANGTPDAKAAADRIIGDVREDGVAALIEELWFDGPRAEPSGKDFGSAWGNIESAGGSL